MKYVVKSEIISGLLINSKNKIDGNISNNAIIITTIGCIKDILYIFESLFIDLAIIKVIEKNISANPMVDAILSKYTVKRLSNCPL